jgi:hypothetical protein
MAIESSLSIGSVARAGAVCLAIATAALAAHSISQPAFSGLDVIEENTLLQRGIGQLIVAGAAGIVISAALYLIDARRAMLWAASVTAFGTVILGATVYQLTGGRDAIEGGPYHLLMLVAMFHGYPAAGIHEAELAGALAIAAGLILLSLAPAPAGPSRVTS